MYLTNFNGVNYWNIDVVLMYVRTDIRADGETSGRTDRRRNRRTIKVLNCNVNE